MYFRRVKFYRKAQVNPWHVLHGGDRSLCGETIKGTATQPLEYRPTVTAAAACKRCDELVK